MKAVPDHILASGPAGTNWYGGSVDRSEMSLRVMAKVHHETVDVKHVTSLLGCVSDRPSHRHWCLHAPESKDADIDSQVAWILNQLTNDIGIWKKIAEDYRVDMFCGFFMERLNRGVSLSVKSMADLSERGIQIGFDIYAPEK